MLEIYFKDDVQKSIKACVVMAIETAIAQGVTNPAFLDGVVALAQAQATLYGFELEDVKKPLLMGQHQ